MKYVTLIILFCFLKLFVFGQDSLPKQPAQPYFPSGFAEYGYVRTDFGFVNAVRDTLWQPKYLGTQVLWLHTGVDTALWVYIGKWIKNTAGVSGSIPSLTFAKNSTKDSIILTYNGVRYAVKDSSGGGTIIDTITGATFPQDLNSVLHVGNTSNQHILLKSDGYLGYTSLDTVTNRSAFIGVLPSGLSGVLLSNGLYNAEINGENITSDVHLILPDANGVFAVGAKLNGITYPASASGIIDLGSIVLLDTTFSIDSANITAFVDSTVNVEPTTHAAGQKVLVGDSATGIFGTRIGSIATWDVGTSSWVYIDPTSLPIGTYLSDANENDPHTDQWNGSVWIRRPTFVPNGGFKIGQPMVIATKDIEPIIFRVNGTEIIRYKTDGNISIAKNIGIGGNKYYGNDPVTGNLVLKPFDTLHVTAIGNSGPSIFVNDSLNVPDYSANSNLLNLEGIVSCTCLLSTYVRGVTTKVFVDNKYDGGIFDYYPSNSQLIVDNVTIFDASDGGYWVRKFNKEDGINISWLGATGQGLADRTNEFTKAFATAQTLGINKVFVPKGYYFANIVIPDGIKLVGDNATIDGTLNDTAATVQINGSNASIQGFTILAKKNDNLQVDKGSNIEISNNIFSATDTSTTGTKAIRVYPSGPKNTTIDNVNIHDNVINTHGTGMWITGRDLNRPVTNVTVNNNIINQVQPYDTAGSGEGVRVGFNTFHTTIHNNHFNADTGFLSDITLQDGPSGVTITGNYIYTKTVGIQVDKGVNNLGVSNFFVTNNHFYGDTGYTVTPNAEDNTINDTTYAFNRGIGINFVTGSVALGGTINNNIFSHIGQSIEGYIQNGGFSYNKVEYCDIYLGHVIGTNVQFVSNRFIGRGVPSHDYFKAENCTNFTFNANTFVKAGFWNFRGNSLYVTNNVFDSAVALFGGDSVTNYQISAPMYFTSSTPSSDVWITGNTVTLGKYSYMISIKSSNYSNTYILNNNGTNGLYGKIYTDPGVTNIYNPDWYNIVLGSVMPTTGTWNKGDRLLINQVDTINKIAYVCTTGGTFGTLSITGTATSGSKAVTVSSITGLFPGAYIKVNSSTSRRVISIDTANLIVNVDVSFASSTSGAVTFVNPTFVTEYRVTTDPSTFGGGAPSGPAGGDLAGTYPNPTIATGAVTDDKASLLVKPAVAVVSVSNLTLSGEQTIDGQLTSSSVVLLTAQTTGSQNGFWVTGSGAWTRPTWYTNGSLTQAPRFLTTFVRLGTTYQGTTWRMTTASVIIGTTATTWVETPLVLNSSNVSGIMPSANGGSGVNNSGTLTWGAGGTLGTAAYLSASNLIDKTVTNTYTAGAKQIFSADATNAGINVAGTTADPSLLAVGDIWLRSDLNKLRYYDGVLVRSVVSEGGIQTLTNKTLTNPNISAIVNTGTQTVPTVTGTLMSYNQTSISSASAPAPTGDSKLNEFYVTALATGATFAAPSGTPANGNELYISVIDNGSAQNLNWNAIYTASTDLPLPAITVAGKVMVMKFRYNTTRTKWIMVAYLNNIP